MRLQEIHGPVAISGCPDKKRQHVGVLGVQNVGMRKSTLAERRNFPATPTATTPVSLTFCRGPRSRPTGPNSAVDLTVGAPAPGARECCDYFARRVGCLPPPGPAG